MDTNQTAFVVTMVIGIAWFIWAFAKAEFERHGG